MFGLYMILVYSGFSAGVDPGFQVRGGGGGGAHLKKLCHSEGGTKCFGVFRQKNHIFSNFRVCVCRVNPPLQCRQVSLYI